MSQYIHLSSPINAVIFIFFFYVIYLPVHLSGAPEPNVNQDQTLINQNNPRNQSIYLSISISTYFQHVPRNSKAKEQTLFNIYINPPICFPSVNLFIYLHQSRHLPSYISILSIYPFTYHLYPSHTQGQ